MDINRNNIDNIINKLEKLYLKDCTKKELLQKQINEKTEEIFKLEEENKTILIKELLLQESAKSAKNKAKTVLENINTNAIQYVFGSDIKVRVDMHEEKKGADIIVLSKEGRNEFDIEIDPNNEDGGGLADIVSLCSFNSIVQLIGKNNKAPLFLDEPTKYVSKGNYAEKVTEYLKDISKVTNKQVLLVTHDEYLSEIGDATFRVKKINGNSQVERIKK